MTKAKVIAAILMATGAAGLSACNTMQGVGEDVEAAGETVTEAAEEAEDDLTDDDPN